VRVALLASAYLLPFLLLAGCSGGGGDAEDVKEFEIHIGKVGDDTSKQYMTPKTITVHQGDKVRFVVTNDDEPQSTDSFHDVALLDYDGNGDGVKDDIEHEVLAGQTVETKFKGDSYFTATEKGTFRIICEVRRGQPTSHENAGMWANFIVE
jgi:plastocyanin